MSNPYYTQAFTGAAGQTARVSQVKSEFNSVMAGFDAIYATISSAAANLARSVRAPTGETLTEMSAAAVRANKLLGFGSTGDISLYSQADTVIVAVTVTTNTSCVKSRRYIIGASSITMTLPASPDDGDTIYFVAKSSSMLSWVVSGGGHNINGSASFTVDIPDLSFGVTYSSAAGEWRIL